MEHITLSEFTGAAQRYSIASDAMREYSVPPAGLELQYANPIHWDFPRRINSVQILVAVGIEHGMTLEQLLAGSGIEVEFLQNPLTEVEACQELRVIRNLQAGCAHIPGLGLVAGARYHATAYDELGYAFISCENFREALRLGEKFFSLTFHFTRFRIEVGADSFSVMVDESGIPVDVRQFLLERDLAALIVGMRDLFPTDPLPLAALSMNFPRLAYGDMFDSLFGVTPSVEQPVTKMTLLKCYLDARPMQANPVTMRMCVALCEMRLDQRAATRRGLGVAARVRARLLASESGFADMEGIASEFGMTSRTLRRRLEAEGTAFRTVLDEVREVMADALFARSDIRVEQVAERLGFSESSSFITAFKRWKGVSPRKFHRGNCAAVGLPLRTRLGGQMISISL